MFRIGKRPGQWALTLLAALVSTPASAQSVSGTLSRLVSPLFGMMLVMGIVGASVTYKWLRRRQHRPDGDFPGVVRSQAWRSLGWGMLIAVVVYSASVLLAGDAGVSLGLWMNSTFVLLLLVFAAVYCGLLWYLVRRKRWSGRYALGWGGGDDHE